MAPSPISRRYSADSPVLPSGSTLPAISAENMRQRRGDRRHGRVSMSAVEQHKPIVHFVGSIPLPDAETVFRTLSAAAGPRLKRLPDGETGIRKTWIRFLQGVLADNPAIEVAQDVAPFKFTD